jgi:hypothetical protein
LNWQSDSSGKVVEHLPSKHEALSSNCSTAKKKKKKKFIVIRIDQTKGRVSDLKHKLLKTIQSPEEKSKNKRK